MLFDGQIIFSFTLIPPLTSSIASDLSRAHFRLHFTITITTLPCHYATCYAFASFANILMPYYCRCMIDAMLRALPLPRMMLMPLRLFIYAPQRHAYARYICHYLILSEDTYAIFYVHAAMSILRY